MSGLLDLWQATGFANFAWGQAIMVAVNQHNQLLLIQRTILISSLIVVTLGVAGKLSGLDPEPRFNLLGVGPATTIRFFEL